jgi:hypothetical protein
VLAMAVPFAIAGVLGSMRLSGSDTHLALVAYLVIAGAGAGFAWRRPEPRFLVVWSLLGWLASLVRIIGGDPDYDLRGRFYDIDVALRLGAPIMLAAAPVVAFALREWTRADETLLQRRVRRLVQLVFALSLVSGFVAFWVTDIDAYGFGMGITAYVIVGVAPGIAVYRQPRTGRVLLWMLLALPCALIAYFVSTLDFSYSSWEPRVLVATISTVFVLIMIAMPIVALATPDQHLVPEARVR